LKKGIIKDIVAQINDIISALETTLGEIKQAILLLDIVADEEEIARLNTASSDPDFWADHEQGVLTSQRLAGLTKHVQVWRDLETETAETLELARANATEHEDNALTTDLGETLIKLTEKYSSLEFELTMSGKYDKNSAIVTIYAGTGGTDAQDWAEMLLRMYLRFCERTGYAAQILDQSSGEEAGIKSVSFEVDGPFAYGKLRSEKGVHRLVRLSPYNADNLRQTSFAMVDIMPKLEGVQEFDISPDDLRIDVYRSGGHGGQSVNTTDSAVRITHLPTNTVVAIQNERSQLQNKEKAMTILKARLAAMMLEQHKVELSEIKGENQAAAWGNQIRSYVLHPYTKVKDHRTEAETSQAADVLDGKLEPFIEAYLKSQIARS